MRGELLAGSTTFLTMAYIIFVQPAVLSGVMLELDTGMDFGAVTTATCLAAAAATLVMGIYARYPIALAPGMGQNFFFVVSAMPVAAAAGSAEPWRVALGAVFVAALLFLVLSVTGLRERLIDAVSPDMKRGIAVGIGLFIAFIGLRNAQLVVSDPASGVRLNPSFLSPDVGVALVGFLVSAVLHARRVRGSILWGIGAALATALVARAALAVLPPEIANAPRVADSLLVTQFALADGIFSLPPSMAPTFLQMDLAGALTAAMVPIIVIFLFMDVFDTAGTLIGVCEQADLLVDGRLPRVERAMLSDALGTALGAAMGTSTVTSYIESAAGVEAGGRSGLTAVTVATLFVAALFCYPVVAMIGSYPPLTAPALVLVGVMMMKNVAAVDWSDHGEAIPSALTILGIPLFFSIADGIALGLVTYPVVNALGGRPGRVRWTTWALALLLLAYFVFVRSRV